MGDIEIGDREDDLNRASSIAHRLLVERGGPEDLVRVVKANVVGLGNEHGAAEGDETKQDE